MSLEELHRRHNLVLNLWIKAHFNGAEPYYRRLAAHYYSLINQEMKHAQLSHHRAA